jgi:hypothetical protein
MSQEWKFVPVEPTQPMLDGMTTERKKGNGVLQMWFEALAAAPSLPVGDVQFVGYPPVPEDRKIPHAGGEEEVIKVQYRVNAGPQTGWSFWAEGNGDEFRNSYQVEVRELVDRAHVTRLQAENAALQQRLNIADEQVDILSGGLRLITSFGSGTNIAGVKTVAKQTLNRAAGVALKADQTTPQ